jgi:hypothetical protein
MLFETQFANNIFSSWDSAWTAGFSFCLKLTENQPFVCFSQVVVDGF